MTITIKDVAKKAGVSISTVSRVINDSKPVSPESRRKVIHAIEELDYQPNEVARSLVTKKSNLIGVIVDDIGSHYVAQIVRGIEEIGRMYDYDIIITSSYGDPDAELRAVNLLKMKQAEGIIVVSEIINKELLELYGKSKKNDFVYLNKYYNLEEFNTVNLDNNKAAKDTMDYIIGQGHRKILYISHELEDIKNIEDEKISGYKEKMEEIEERPMIYTLEGRMNHQAYNAGDKIVEIIKENDITAVFLGHDNSAIGLLNYFYDNDISVPEEISVVGYGDITGSSIIRPSLTSIKEPYYDIGAVAVRHILKSLNDEEIEDEPIVLPMRLMKRKSCRKLD